MSEPTGKHPFVYHKPTEQQVAQIDVIRNACRGVYDLLCANLPPCVERSNAIKALEEVSMWANKGVVMYDKPLSEYVRPYNIWPR